MMKFAFLSALLAGGFFVISWSQKMLGPGKWNVINVKKCEEDARMLLKVDVSRRKINRTHDGFNVKLKLEENLDDSYAIRVDVCKFVDGGCKLYHVLADDSFENFVKKYAASNVERMFVMAGIDPPDFPVPVGEHTITGYVMNYEELPEDGPYGEYGSKAFLLKDGLEKGCVYVHSRFDELEEER